MKRRARARSQQKQINILHTTTRQRHSRQQVTHLGFWASIVLAMAAVVGVGLHYSIGLLLNQVLYHNPRYTLRKIEIDPAGRFSEYPIRQATGLEPGQQNLWALNLPQITSDLEQLANVSSAKVERRFPDRLVIHIKERIPVVQIWGIDMDVGKRAPFFLDRDCIVLKPRPDEPPPAPPLPEVIGLSNSQAEVEPGVRLEDSSLVRALQILNDIDHTSTLHTSIDIRSIDLSQPLSIKMVTTHDLVITFRPDCIDQQLSRLVAIFDRYGNDQERTLHTIDLTPDQNVPITFYE